MRALIGARRRCHFRPDIGRLRPGRTFRFLLLGLLAGGSGMAAQTVPAPLELADPFLGVDGGGNTVPADPLCSFFVSFVSS